MEYLWYQQGDIANYALNLDLVARTIFTLLPVKLTLGITCKGVAFPLLFSLLDKCGNSNWEERKDIMERFIRLFGHDRIDCLVAEREFIGKEWIGWLNDNRIRYYIRIRQASQMLLTTDDSVTKIAVSCGFNSSNYFKDCFRRINGVSPRAFRKQSETHSFEMDTQGTNTLSPVEGLRTKER